MLVHRWNSVSCALAAHDSEFRRWAPQIRPGRRLFSIAGVRLVLLDELRAAPSARYPREEAMRHVTFAAVATVLALGIGMADRAAAQDKPIKIGINTAIQLQVGRDAVDAAKMAIDE